MKYSFNQFSINDEDLVRESCTAEYLKKNLADPKPIFFPSPNSKHCLITSHFIEWRMGAYSGLPTLLDEKSMIIEKFEPIAVCRAPVQWTPNSDAFYVLLDDYRSLLIVDVIVREFAVIKVNEISSCILQWSMDSKAIKIIYDPKTLASVNSEMTFAKGKAQWPIKRYKAPEPKIIDIQTLKWNSFNEIPKTYSNFKDNDKYDYDMSKISDGYFEFHGAFPLTTEDTFNTRQMEGCHLEAFAEYGDPQSQEWFEEFMKKCDKDKVYKWEKVSKYLGLRHRK